MGAVLSLPPKDSAEIPVVTERSRALLTGDKVATSPKVLIGNKFIKIYMISIKY